MGETLMNRLGVGRRLVWAASKYLVWGTRKLLLDRCYPTEKRIRIKDQNWQIAGSVLYQTWSLVANLSNLKLKRNNSVTGNSWTIWKAQIKWSGLGVRVARVNDQFYCKSTLRMGSKGGDFQTWKKSPQWCWQMTNLGKYQGVQLITFLSLREMR